MRPYASSAGSRRTRAISPSTRSVDAAAAGAASAAPAFEGYAALLAQRHSQQVRVRGCTDGLAAIGDEGDRDGRAVGHGRYAANAVLRSAVSMWPKLVRCSSSSKAPSL